MFACQFGYLATRRVVRCPLLCPLSADVEPGGRDQHRFRRSADDI